MSGVKGMKHGFAMTPAARTRNFRLRAKARDPEAIRQKNRADSLWRLYEITPDEYAAISAAQGGVCAICHQPESDARRKYLSVDHVPGSDPPIKRGLLCSRHNAMLGMAGDSAALLRQAALYLETRC
jgi:hypothetical protein